VPSIEAFGATNVGRRRESNEDAFLFGRVGRFLSVDGTSLPEKTLDERYEQAGWYAVVADGMGGRAAGEVASRTALVAAFEVTLRRSRWVTRVTSEEVPEILVRMRDLVEGVHAAVSEFASGRPDLAGMGTTFTLARIAGSSLVVGHVGDSRIYLHRRGVLRQLTRDQTSAQILADLGEIRPEEVARHRLSHILTQAVGSGKPLKVEVRHLWLIDGDELLLASDGLSGVVPEEQIAASISRGGSAREVVARLIAQALDRGGPDNVTAVFARIRGITGGAGDETTRTSA